MPFRPPSPSDGPLAKVDCLAEKDPVTVREDHLADVELVAVAVSDPQKVRYGGLAEKEGVDEGSRVGRLRRTTEAALVKTWSYELAATTRYKGVGEAMRVEGGGLRRTVEDFQWCRLALVAEHPGVVVPPLGVEAQAGDADAPARWLMLLLEHPQLKSNDALKVFCLGSPSEFAAAQRDHVPFKDPTPLAVHLGALYIKGRETLSRERKQVIEEDAQEEKDEKRKKHRSTARNRQCTRRKAEDHEWQEKAERKRMQQLMKHHLVQDSRIAVTEPVAHRAAKQRSNRRKPQPGFLRPESFRKSPPS